MITLRDRSSLVGGGYITTGRTSVTVDAEKHFEFSGDGTGSVSVLDDDNEEVFCNLNSIKLYVNGIRWNSLWWTAAHGTNGTVVTLTSPRTFPINSRCIIDYTLLIF